MLSEKPHSHISANAPISAIGIVTSGMIVPRSERFYAGGSATLRGFAQNAVGSIGPNRIPIGGEAMLILNNELRMPLVSIFDVLNQRKPSSAVAVCHKSRLALTFENGKIASARLAPKLAPGSVRYSCAATPTSLKLKVTAPGAKGGLRRAIGPTLQLGVATSAKAAKSSTKLTFTFS